MTTTLTRGRRVARAARGAVAALALAGLSGLQGNSPAVARSVGPEPSPALSAALMRTVDLAQVFAVLTIVPHGGATSWPSRCDGDIVACLTSYVPVQDALAPVALAQALARDADEHKAIEAESQQLLTAFRESAAGQSRSLADSIALLVMQAAAAEGRAPTPAEAEGFTRALRVLLATSEAFQRSGSLERQMTDEICGVLAKHLESRRIWAQRSGQPHVRQRVTEEARHLVAATLRVDVTALDWRPFERTSAVVYTDRL